MTVYEVLTGLANLRPRVLLVHTKDRRRLPHDRPSTRNLFDPLGLRLRMEQRCHLEAPAEVEADGTFYLAPMGVVVAVQPLVLDLASGDPRRYMGTRDVSRAILRADRRLTPFKMGAEYYLLLPLTDPPEEVPPTLMSCSFWLCQRADFFTAYAVNVTGELFLAEQGQHVHQVVPDELP